MSNKIVFVDFKTKQKIGEEVIEEKKVILDPILQEVKEGLDEDAFEVYKKVVDDWMRRNFEKQLKENDWSQHEV